MSAQRCCCICGRDILPEIAASCETFDHVSWLAEFNTAPVGSRCSSCHLWSREVVRCPNRRLNACFLFCVLLRLVRQVKPNGVQWQGMAHKTPAPHQPDHTKFSITIHRHQVNHCNERNRFIDNNTFYQTHLEGLAVEPCGVVEFEGALATPSSNALRKGCTRLAAMRSPAIISGDICKPMPYGSTVSHCRDGFCSCLQGLTITRIPRTRPNV